MENSASSLAASSLAASSLAASSLAKRARYKLFGSILTTYGYAILGVATIQPLMSDHSQELTAPRRWGILLAVVLQGAAVYIAPKGEAA